MGIESAGKCFKFRHLTFLQDASRARILFFIILCRSKDAKRLYLWKSGGIFFLKENSHGVC